MSAAFSHASVLLTESVDALQVREGFTYADFTTGGGGHSYEIASRMGKEDRLLCFDRDADALKAAKERLREFGDRIVFIHENFSEFGRVVRDLNITNLGGVVADLGCSSYQFDTPERGFSYRYDAPLDMRMDVTAPLSAFDVVNTYPEERLIRIFYEYGEERFAPRIAARIVKERGLAPIRTTLQLSELIRAAIPAANRDGSHPAKRSFQAIRIEVNGELDAIAPALNAAIDALVPGGRIAVISFHSLEDRIVKNTFAAAASGCTCPRDFPICVCGKKPKVTHIGKKAILPTQNELEENPRAHSAKLRVAEKLPL